MRIFSPVFSSRETSIQAVPCFLFSPMGIRLGVGAPLPETPAPAQTRLVQKLEGGKRRARNMENGDLAESAMAAMADDGRSGREGEDSAEEESRVARASAVRKRPRVADPFEPGRGKGKKRTKKAATVEKTETEETTEAAEATAPVQDVAVEEALPMMVSVDAATTPNPKKRRKKKKTAEMETQLMPEGESEAQGQGAQGRAVAPGGPVCEPRSPDRGAEGSAQSHSGVLCISTSRNRDVSYYRSAHQRFEIAHNSCSARRWRYGLPEKTAGMVSFDSTTSDYLGPLDSSGVFTPDFKSHWFTATSP